MNPSLLKKLDQLAARADELGHLLSDPAVIGEQQRFRALSRELADIQPLSGKYRDYREVLAELESTRTMLGDDDAGIRKLAEEELPRLEESLEALADALRVLLLPGDSGDNRNVFLEIRAGAGGDEAALFCGDLFQMYQHYAESHRWRVEIISHSPGEYGGYKEIISRIIGRGVYARLKFESGAHRVQRVPETEAQGRIHTSVCTVAILPEAEDIDEIEIGQNDLRIDTFRASGAGGQHVNRTDSAVRITHLPSGVVVECQDERSQHKNRARAMSVLKARLLDAERARRRREEDATRRSLVGSGDRSERIRTYNFPQGRITDHRIGLTLYQLAGVLAGALDPVIEPLATEYQAEQLAALAAE